MYVSLNFLTLDFLGISTTYALFLSYIILSSFLIALFTLITTIFHLRNIGEENFGKCWEDHLCHQLIALTLLDFVADVILILFLRFPRVLLASLYRREWGYVYKDFRTIIFMFDEMNKQNTSIFTIFLFILKSQIPIV